ncbi:MAG TPA: Asp-tRNA(Asn)/Glu-tRNA(Gln) amidotransferase subunit GatB [Armatimonadota bacterium]|nr:Asp-tRNA(Asn)/Glu-tRNA(Gln) amidotransferase subunit GatB [Armatimonadota bacterium]
MVDYEPVIGFEIHAELATASKVFCGCGTEPGAPPNTHTCPVCLGLPGALPVLNVAALEYALKVVLACHCDVPSPAIFERKNYYYPDLPKNYQISQKRAPFGVNGWFEFEVNGAMKRVRILDIHLEEDAGKLVHPQERGAAGVSLVDYNRAGVPLLEIVSGPDIHSVEEAEAYMIAMRRLLRYLGVSEARMELGQIRFEANISVRPVGSATLGTRVEIKNLNSYRTVIRGIEYEVARQTALHRNGERVAQETRLFDDARGITLAMRDKEEAHDYRYFPDPDLVPMRFTPEYLERLRAGLPELPAARRARFISAYGLPAYDAALLTDEKAIADFVDAAVALSAPPKSVSNWTMGELLRLLNERGLSPDALPITPAHLAALITLVESGAINQNQAKQVFAEMFETGKEPALIVKEQGFAQISDAGALEAIVNEVVAANPDPAARYAAGEDKPLGFLVGQVMKRSGGKANAPVVNAMLREKLRGG